MRRISSGALACVRLFLALAVAVPLLAQPHVLANPPRVLHVAAAADLEPVLPRLLPTFEQQTGIHVVVSYASSATLVQQIRNGSPADVFLSANRSYAQQLIDAHLAKQAMPVPYATGVLVLWSRRAAGSAPPGMASLTSPRVQRIAIANPEHAPYGAAARDALLHEHLLPSLAPKLVTAENIAGAAQFALTGNADVGFLSLTIASTAAYTAAGSYTRVPAQEYPALSQCAVTLHASPEATAFLAWLTSGPTQARLPALGLDPALRN